MVRVQISSADCQGHGMCYQRWPEVFADDEQGYGTVKGEPTAAPGEAVVDERYLQEVAHAASCCPERAITVSTDALAGN